MPIYLPSLVLEITDTAYAMPTKPNPLPVFGIMTRELHPDFVLIAFLSSGNGPNN